VTQPPSTRDIAGAGEPRRDTPAADEHAGTRKAEPPVAAETHPLLLHEEEARGLRSRWEAIQTGFVDEPRAAVEQADVLVAELMKRLAEVFAEERSTLESQWGRGDSVSTEDLRVALTRYRSFFHRLLSV
jgi:glutathione S-transferase